MAELINGEDILTIDGVSGALHDDFEAELEEMTHDEKEEFICDKVLKLKSSILSSPSVFAVLREHFNNDMLDLWTRKNPRLAFPIDIETINNDPRSRSISDDDFCYDCAFLAYVPGDVSLCMKASDNTPHPIDSWPCENDDDHYSIDCGEHLEVIDSKNIL